MMTTQLPNLDTSREKSSPPNVVQGRKRFDLPDPPRHGPSPPLRQQIFSAFSLYAALLQTNLITLFFQMCFLEYCSQRSLYLCLLPELGKISLSLWNCPWISSWKRNFPFYWVLFSSYHTWHILLGKVAIYQHILSFSELEMRKPMKCSKQENKGHIHIWMTGLVEDGHANFLFDIGIAGRSLCREYRQGKPLWASLQMATW